MRPALNPIEQQHGLALSKSPLIDEPERYRRLIGHLIYSSATRPDLAYSVHILSQFMHQPRQDHWNAVMRVLRYLKGSVEQGVFLSAESDLRLRAWCDSDWGRCPLTRHSVCGWIVALGNSPVCWKTSKQEVVSRSSAEAEYQSMALTVCELKWLRHLLSDLGIRHDEPMELHCDNQSCAPHHQEPGVL